MTRVPHPLFPALLFVAGSVVAVWQQLNAPAVGFGSFWEAPAIARSLAAGRGFSNPFGITETGPTAHLAPAFPLLLALLIQIFGDTPDFARAAVLMAALAHGLYCVMLVPLSGVLFEDRRPGMAAGLFSALVPTIQVFPQWDAIYAAVAGQLFCLATAKPAAPAWLAGLLCGGLLLLNPAMLPVAVAWMIWRGATLRQWTAFALGTTLALLPWTVRNYYVMGGLFLVRDSLGSELYMSNADCSRARDMDNELLGCHALLQPNRSEAEAAELKRMGEYAFNQDRAAAARRWIFSHPSRFASLTLARLREFWFPTPEHWAVFEYSRWLLTAASAIGLRLMLRRRRRAALFLGGGALLYSLVYYGVQSSPRYRTPALWLSALPAGYALVQARQRASEH